LCETLSHSPWPECCLLDETAENGCEIWRCRQLIASNWSTLSHIVVHLLSRVGGWAAIAARPQCETLSTAPHSQAEDYLSATKRVRFRNRLTLVPLRNRLHPNRNPGSCFGGGRRTGLLGFAISLLAGLADINPALEIGAVFDADALRDHVSRERAFAPDVHPVAGRQVAANFAQHHDFARRDIGRNHAVAAHGHPVAGQVDGSLHSAVNVKRLRAGDFAFDDQRLAERGLLLRVDRGAGRTRRALRLGSRRRIAALWLGAGGRGRGRSVGWFPHIRNPF